MSSLALLRRTALVLSGACVPHFSALAAEAPVSIVPNASVTSDYRFRGLSLSDRDPAVQGGIDATTSLGLFAGAWGSTIDDYGGAEIEVDLYGGYQNSAAGFDYALTAVAYVYPGGSDVNYGELQGNLSRAIGPATASLEVAYAPDQKNTDTGNFYLGAGIELPLPGTPITAKLRGGRENGYYDNKWDWEVGVSYTRGWLTASATYVDTNYSGANEAGKWGKAGLVATLAAEF